MPYDLLPSSVQTDLNNAALSTVTFPAGDYRLAGTNTPGAGNSFELLLSLTRSNVTVNAAGCTLHYFGEDNVNTGVEIFKIASKTRYDNYNSGRFQLHASGQITSGTTQLTLQESPIGGALYAGEQVIIWAGVNTTDPAEPYAFLKGTVASFNSGTNVVTFASPLAVNVPTYANQAALEAQVDPSLHFKIGMWGAWYGANYSKGYGYDHGIERFTDGVRVSNVVVNDLKIVCHHSNTSATVPRGCNDVSLSAVENVTLNRLQIENVIHSGILAWRSFDVNVNEATYTGDGITRLYFGEGYEYFTAGYAAVAWGGENFRGNNLRVSGNNIAGILTEVTPRNLVIDGFRFDGVFNSARTYASPDQVFGFYGITTNDPIPIVKNATISLRYAGGSGAHYFNGVNCFTNGRFVISDKYLTYYLPHGNPQHLGRVHLSGNQFGPPQTITQEYTIADPGGGNVLFSFPAGLIVSGRIRLKTMGDASALGDPLGGITDAYDTSWRTLGERFTRQVPGAGVVDAYLLYQYITVYFTANGVQNDAVIELELTYHPLLNTATGSKLGLFTGTQTPRVPTSAGSPKIFNKV